jgi:hypothetical protein
MKNGVFLRNKAKELVYKDNLTFGNDKISFQNPLQQNLHKISFSCQSAI